MGKEINIKPTILLWSIFAKINNLPITFKISGKKGFFLLSDSFVGHRNKVLTEENPKTEFLVDRAILDIKRI